MGGHMRKLGAVLAAAALIPVVAVGAGLDGATPAGAGVSSTHPAAHLSGA